MRKDLRIGLGIGAVLLLVLIVALVVRSNGKNKQLAADHGDVEEIDGASSEGGTTYPREDSGTPPPTGSGVAQGHTDPALTPATPAKPPVDNVFGPDESPAVAGQRGSDWEMLLSGHTGGGAAVSETPTGPRTNRGNGTGASASLPPMAATGRGRPDAGMGMLDSVTPPAPQPQRDPAAGRTHVVRAGETFSSIARSAYGNPRYYRQIATANPGVNPNALKPGTTLVLPPLGGGSATATDTQRTPRPGNRAPAGGIDRSREYQVAANDSLYKISEKLYGDGSRVDAIYDLNRSTIGPDPRKLKLGMILKLPEVPSVASGR